MTRAEFLKTAIVSANITVPEITKSYYSDVPPDSWYGKYFEFSRQHKLLSPQARGAMKPNQKITRKDASYILWKLKKLS